MATKKKMLMSSAGSAGVGAGGTGFTLDNARIAPYGAFGVFTTANESSPEGVTFKPDGTKMYVAGPGGDGVHEFDLSTAWDLSSSSYIDTFNTNAEDVVQKDVAFKTDGTKMYVAGQNSATIYEYNLSTAWDTSSASYYQNFSVSDEETNLTGLTFKSDGTEMYITGGSKAIWRFTLSTAWDVTSASISSYGKFYTGGEEVSPSDLTFKPDGTKMYIIGTNGDEVNEYNLSTAWDVTSASYVQNFSINETGRAFESTPRSVEFKADGTRMYVSGTRLDKVLQWDLSTAWDISTASYDDEFSVATQHPNASSLFWKSDGTKMYVTGYTGDDVTEYSLTTAWDVQTASYNADFSVSSQLAVPRGLSFKSDGTKMYVVGSANNQAVNEYSLSTAWDVTSASYVQDFSVSNQTTGPTGVSFKSDGTEMYICGSSSVFQYSLSTAWDVSTASWDAPSASGDYLSVASRDNAPEGLSFKADGTKMYFIGSSNDAVFEYNLSTAWNISTASYVQNFSVSLQDPTPKGVTFKPDGTTMFIVGISTDVVYSYTLSTAWDLSTASWDVPANSLLDVRQNATYPTGLAFKSDGNKVYIADSSATKIVEYNLSTSWDVSTGSYVQGLSLSSEGSAPSGVAFKSDGTRMYVIFQSPSEVGEYSLSTAWDISTSSHVQTFSTVHDGSLSRGISLKSDGTQIYIMGYKPNVVWAYTLSTAWDISTASISSYGFFGIGSQDTSATGVTFKVDGTKMYVVGQTNDAVFEYNLSTAWDITTASYYQTFSASSDSSQPQDIKFKPDGTKMYLTDRGSDSVLEYSLSTAWDVSTAASPQHFGVSTQETDPHSLAFKTDGSKMYVLGQNGDDVNEYNLSTAWDVSTASYVQNFSVFAKQTSSTGLAFKSDGTKMYVSGYGKKSVSEYNLSTAWDLSTASFSVTFSTLSIIDFSRGLEFSQDGTKMYAIDASGSARRVVRFNLSTAWDLSTASWDGPSDGSLVTEGASPTDVFINEDGLKVFTTDMTGRFINEYTLSTAWDLSTYEYIQGFSIFLQDQAPQGLSFKADGTKMYMCGGNSKSIWTYSLN